MRFLKQTILFLFVLFLTLQTGCKKENPIEETKKGDLLVEVFRYNWDNYYREPVEGAVVYTQPKTKEYVTDQYGSVLISNLDAISYEIFAALPGEGAGKGVLQIKSDSLSYLRIIIDKTMLPMLHPIIDVVKPTLPANFSTGEPVIFSVNIDDPDSSMEQITVTITSDLDGVIYTGHPTKGKNVFFSTIGLSKGIHAIEIKAVDNDEHTTRKKIELNNAAPKKLALSNSFSEEHNIVLEWEKIEEDGFERYEIYRANTPEEAGQLIASFHDFNQTTFTDAYPPLVQHVFYYIRLLMKDGQFNDSERIKIESPAGKIYSGNPRYAVHHPTEPIIYIVDELSNRLKSINYETGRELHSTSMQGAFGSICIADNGFGLEIYAPSSLGGVMIYDAATLNVIGRALPSIGCTAVESNGKGFFVATKKYGYQESLHMVSRNSLSEISLGGYASDWIRFIPGSNDFIGISTQIFPDNLSYYKVSSEGIIVSRTEDAYHGDYNLDAFIFKISPRGDLLITGCYGTIFSADDQLSYLGQINNRGSEYCDFEFSKDGKFIYAANKLNQAVDIVRYPDILIVDEVKTKATPAFLFMQNDKLISLSKIDTKTMLIEPIITTRP